MISSRVGGNSRYLRQLLVFVSELTIIVNQNQNIKYTLDYSDYFYTTCVYAIH